MLLDIKILLPYLCRAKNNCKMKQIIVCMMVALSTSSIVTAQNQPTFRFNAGPELGFATGSFSNTHSIGIGGSVQGEVSLQEHLYGTASFGVTAYKGKSSGSNTNYKVATIIPLRVGAKYFLTGGFYGSFQLGVGFLNNTTPGLNIINPNTDASGTAFAYSPQIGYEFKTKNYKSIDATFKYDGYSGGNKIGTVGTIGFRLAYIF